MCDRLGALSPGPLSLNERLWCGVLEPPVLGPPKLNWIDFLRGASSAYEMRLLPDAVSLGSGKGSSDSKETRGEDDDSEDMVFLDGFFGARYGGVS